MTRRRRKRGSPKEQGLALIMVLSAIAILSVVLADMHESTGTDFAVAVSLRDRLRAEYMAKSGLNLTRLLVASEEPIRAVVAPFYQAAIGRPPPQLPVWTYADMILKPFCDYESVKDADIGFDLRSVEGMGDLPGTCSIVAVAENSKINVNDPLLRGGTEARTSTAMQVFAMTGGYQTQSPYDVL
ncbi:MAG: hypothetical protein KC416_00515, partial [Myxococcales bacterium]|nr:hypothetical protein [Myxococcales bacterium]